MRPERLYAREAIRRVEARLFETREPFEVMASAAEAAWRRLRARWPRARSIGVCCGPGHNGGDGALLAAFARREGLDVRRHAPRAPTTADALRAAAMADAAGVLEAPVDAVLDCDVRVDALYGIGLARELEGADRALVEAFANAPRPVLAIDVPSGLCADSGAVLGAAVRADLTVTFLGRKRGLHTGAARACTGEVALETLGADALLEDDGVAWLDRRWLRGRLPRRARDAHKGRYGHVLVVGGAHGYGGAAILAVTAAARAGAGLVSALIEDDSARGALLAARPEAMTPEPDVGFQRASVLAVGPGLGQGARGEALLERALASKLPLVLDADALNLLGTRLDRVREGSVLTPHPGEAARLLGTDVASVERDRYGAAAAIAEGTRSVVVLKGAGSVVAAHDGRLAVCGLGNAGMASGGMGDVLTGLIAALRAQGFEPWDAACLGTTVHAHAADLAVARRRHEVGLLASDVIEALPDAW